MKNIIKLIIKFFKRLFGIKAEEENIEPTVPSTEDSGTTEPSTIVVESGDTEFECPQMEITPIADSEDKLKITFTIKENN